MTFEFGYIADILLIDWLVGLSFCTFAHLLNLVMQTNFYITYTYLYEKIKSWYVI